MTSCPSCAAVFEHPVEAENQTPTPETDATTAEATQNVEGNPSETLLVQQVTSITGVPAGIVPKWRRLKPVAVVALLAPLGLLMLGGIVLTGDIYKPERDTVFFQPLDQTEKIKLAAASALVQSVLLVLILSI